MRNDAKGDCTMASDLLDVPKSASYLNLKNATVRAWILDGKLNYVKLGRRVFLRRQDLDELIAESLVLARRPKKAAK
jgi:excisionase family DNA binding protein